MMLEFEIKPIESTEPTKRSAETWVGASDAKGVKRE